MELQPRGRPSSPWYASGEDRLRELAGMSERVRGVGAGRVSTSQGDTIADDGDDAEVTCLRGLIGATRCAPVAGGVSVGSSE